MYNEKILDDKNSECVKLWYEWFELFKDDDKRHGEECKALRKRWCKCVDEHSQLLSLEVKTNPIYDEVKKNR